MTDTASGLYARLLLMSFQEMLRAGLDELGWFDEGRQHASVTIVPEPRPWDQLVEPNLIAVSTGESDQTQVELGNGGAWGIEVPFLVDLYAESEALGLHLSHDIADIIRGRHPDAGRTSRTFSVYDYLQATPSQVGYATVLEVNTSRGVQVFDKPWLSNWYTVVGRVAYTVNAADPVD